MAAALVRAPRGTSTRPADGGEAPKEKQHTHVGHRMEHSPGNPFPKEGWEEGTKGLKV